MKAWRARVGLSQFDAAKELGVPTRTLQGWEIARYVPIPAMRRMLEKQMARTK